MEESADKSAEWSGEDTEDLELEEEAETAGGAGEYGRPLKATVGKLEKSSAEDDPGGAAAGRGATANDTSTDANKAGAGDRYGASSEVRERVAGRREIPAVDSSGVWLANPPE